MRLLRLIAVNLLVLLGLLLLVEGAVRLTHPRVGPLGSSRALVSDSVYGAAPGIAASAQGESAGAWFASTADHVWRYSADPPLQAPTWLFLGDSVTMGTGVDPDSTFAGRLAGRVHVQNTALIGLGARDYAHAAQARLARGGVDRVVMVWCLNDLYAPSMSEDAPAGMRGLIGPLHSFVLRYVRTYQVLKAAFLDRPRVYYDHDIALYADSSLIAAARSEIATVAQASAASGAAFEVVVMPYRAALTDSEWPSRIDPFIHALASDGIAAFDASRWLGGADPVELFRYDDGIHLSALGHSRVAKGLAETIDSNAKGHPATCGAALEC